MKSNIYCEAESEGKGIQFLIIFDHFFRTGSSIEVTCEVPDDPLYPECQHKIRVTTKLLSFDVTWYRYTA